MASSFEKTIKGQQALKVYHDQSSRFGNWGFRDFRAFLDHVTALNPKNVELLGSVIGELSTGEAANVMRNLAEKHKGILPAKFSDLMKPFTNPENLKSWTSWDSVKAIAGAVPDAVGDTVDLVADTAKTTLWVSSYAVPLALAVAVGFLVFQKGGGSLSDLKKAFKR